MMGEQHIELSDRVDELYSIYVKLGDLVIITELQRSQERLEEQLARQQAISRVLGERAVE